MRTYRALVQFVSDRVPSCAEAWERTAVRTIGNVWNAVGCRSPFDRAIILIE